MILALIVLILFLLAFAGLAVGVICKGRGLRGGCQPHGNDDACQCSKENKHAGTSSASTSCCQAENRDASQCSQTRKKINTEKTQSRNRSFLS